VSSCGIHLVEACAKRQRVPLGQVLYLPYVANIIADSRSQPLLHYWLVHRQGSAEIIHWGRESTEERARTSASSFMRELVTEEEKMAA